MNPQIRGVLGCFLLLLASACRAQTAAPDVEFSRHIQRAQSYLEQKRPDLAIPELQAAATIDPDNIETQSNLGVLLFFQGKPAEAIPHLRMAVQKQPSLSKIQGILGIAELHTQEIVEGRKDLETAFPAIEDQRFKLQVGLELVGAYTDSGDLEQAAGILAQLKKIAPDNPEVLYASYRTFTDLTSEAMIALSLAAPDSAQMHQLLAHEEIKEGKANVAIAQYRKAIAIDPRLPGVHFELAELLRTSQDPAMKKQAEQEYRAAIQENPQDEKTICALAEIAETKGDTQQAYNDYSQAVALDPGDANAKLGLAKVLIGMDQQDKALPLLEASVQLEPTNATVHYRLATLYRKMGRVDDAKREIELYQKYKEMKDKLRAVYKELLIQPDEIRAGEDPEEESSGKK
jgi:tetratricopeptide (TPR) repeat protein